MSVLRDCPHKKNSRPPLKRCQCIVSPLCESPPLLPLVGHCTEERKGGKGLGRVERCCRIVEAAADPLFHFFFTFCGKFSPIFTFFWSDPLFRRRRKGSPKPIVRFSPLCLTSQHSAAHGVSDYEGENGFFRGGGGGSGVEEKQNFLRKSVLVLEMSSHCAVQLIQRKLKLLVLCSLQIHVRISRGGAESGPQQQTSFIILVGCGDGVILSQESFLKSQPRPPDRRILLRKRENNFS